MIYLNLILNNYNEYEFFEPVYIYKISLQIIVEIGRKKRNNRNRF